MMQKILEFGNSVVRFLHIESLVKPLYHRLFKSKELNKQRTLFINNAHEVLNYFDHCMSLERIPYTLAFGTLLGAIREHGFIKHDMDIDTMIWSDNYTESFPEQLGKYGFRRVHSFLIESGNLGREETYEFLGVQIDIFFIYPPINDHPYCCDFLRRDCLTFEACIKKYGSLLPRRIELPIDREITYVPFENMKLPVPVNAHEILAYRYGNDYLTPNPDWNIQSYNEHIIEWPEKEGLYFGE